VFAKVVLQTSPTSKVHGQGNKSVCVVTWQFKIPLETFIKAIPGFNHFTEFKQFEILYSCTTGKANLTKSSPSSK